MGFQYWSGQQDSNLRPPLLPKSGVDVNPITIQCKQVRRGLVWFSAHFTPIGTPIVRRSQPAALVGDGCLAHLLLAVAAEVWMVVAVDLKEH
jgi:hypothetical protein